VSETGESPDKIKVVDRRRFTESGELRPDRAAPAPAQPARPSPEPADSGRDEAPAKPPVTPERPVEEAPTSAAVTSETFLELVETLAQQTELFLHGAAGLPKQPEQARRLMDYLGVLESKTRGNLSAEESQILSNVIFQLRMRIVQSGA